MTPFDALTLGDYTPTNVLPDTYPHAEACELMAEDWPVDPETGWSELVDHMETLERDWLKHDATIEEHCIRLGHEQATRGVWWRDGAFSSPDLNDWEAPECPF